MNVLEKIERWWASLSETQQLIVMIVFFVAMLIANPFIN